MKRYPRDMHGYGSASPDPRWPGGAKIAVQFVINSEEGGFAYVAGSNADDLPYWMRFRERGQLIVPYTLDANDMRFATPQGFNAGDQCLAYLKDSFDALYAEGRASAPKILSIGLHCRLVGRPGRVMALRRFIDYARSHEAAGFARRAAGSARRIDIAEHCMATFPPGHFRRPSEMDRDAFVAAHPDLAGKLAAARRLTAESTAKQASAGLDALTDEEKAAFTQLNEVCMAKFGFPFIIALRDHDMGSTLEAFRRRLARDRETEFAEVCRQVERIAEHRLTALLPA
jgi:OHCU decarboxylase